MNYNDTHREIVEACMQGQRHAQFELYKLYSKAMYNICTRMLNSVEDAEDVLQQSFTDVFTKLHYFRFDSSIGAWIKRIVVNNCINFLKKKKLQLVELQHERYVEKTDTKASQPVLNIQLIQQALSKLSDGYRVVFSLYAMEGYDHKEIAEILDISVSTSKSQYSRAKAKLKELILQSGGNVVLN